MSHLLSALIFAFLSSVSQGYTAFANFLILLLSSAYTSRLCQGVLGSCMYKSLCSTKYYYRTTALVYSYIPLKMLTTYQAYAYTMYIYCDVATWLLVYLEHSNLLRLLPEPCFSRFCLGNPHVLCCKDKDRPHILIKSKVFSKDLANDAIKRCYLLVRVQKLNFHTCSSAFDINEATLLLATSWLLYNGL